MEDNKRELIFVYNATLSLGSLAKDFLAEVLPNQPAECNLCSITYSLAFKKKVWKEFLEDLDMPSSFYLKDSFRKKFPGREEEYPALWLREGEKWKLLLDGNAMDKFNDVESLMDAIVEVLKD